MNSIEETLKTASAVFFFEGEGARALHVGTVHADEFHAYDLGKSLPEAYLNSLAARNLNEFGSVDHLSDVQRG